jgi:hypothetical protein
MSALVEATIVEQIAAQERLISGVKNSFGFAANPDILPSAALPAVIHYFPHFEVEPRAHHNVWKESLILRSVLFVAPREGSGGKLKFLENAALPFGYLWRTHFQTDSVVSNLLSNIGAVRAYLVSGDYGAGGIELTYGAVEFLGFVFSFEFTNA